MPVSMPHPMPVPPASAPPTARPQRVSRTEQRQAVEDMEAAAKDLESVLADTEDMGKERQLYRFETGIRELNQLNALKRAEAMQEQHQEAERRGSWNAALGNGQVFQREAVQEEYEDESRNDMLGYHGGAVVTRTGGWFKGRKSLITEGEKGEFTEEEAAKGSFQGRTSIRASMRIVGTLTPALLRARRRSSVSTNGGRPLSAGADSAAMLPPVPSRRRSTGLGVCQATGIGSLEEKQRIPNTERSERNSFAADTGGDERTFMLEERRPSTARRPSSSRRRSSTQQDSSSTRVTGKIDYAALLNEQEQDMQARRESTDQYKNMLTQVEEYQQKMLEHLDSQLVFMGITESDIEATAKQLADGQNVQ